MADCDFRMTPWRRIGSRPVPPSPSLTQAEAEVFGAYAGADSYSLSIKYAPSCLWGFVRVNGDLWGVYAPLSREE